MTATAERAREKARQAEGSTPVEGLARLGLVGRGVLYALVGLLALQVARGHGARADRDGALAAVKDEPFGKALLVVLAVGFLGYAGWRALNAVVGHRDERSRRRRALERAGSLGAGLVYAALAWTTFRFATSHPSGDQTRPVTARLLALPGGPVVVGLVGAGVVVGGLWLLREGLGRGYLDRLDRSLSGPVRTVAVTSGLLGEVGRGVVVCLVGAFLVQAAVTFDPGKAKGLDAALKKVASEPFGPVLLGATAVGLLAFGVWSLVEARYRRL